MTQQHLTPLRLSFILLLVASGVLGAGKLRAQSEGVSVSYSLESSTTTMHEPIIVRFEVSNGSKEPMTVQLGVDRTEGFAIQVKWPDGSAHKRPPAPVREGIRRTGDVSLAPGEHLRHELLLNEWASFNTPGKYELDVRLLTPIETAGGKFVSEPYHASFRVLPRDESQLKATCERLVRQIESTDNVSQAQDAAAALAHVDDPIVVPYLERALRSGKYVEDRIIAALAKVGSEDAAQILLGVVKESPGWPPSVQTTAGTRAILAQRALQKIVATTSNERLKQKINGALPR
jgi:hypothetical protein